MGHPPGSAPGRSGLRPGEAGAAQRDPRPLRMRADRLRFAGTGFRQQRDPGPLRHPRTQAALPRAAAGQPDHLLLLDDRAAGRRRPEGVHHQRRARRRPLGHQRREVVLVVRVDGVVHDRDGGDGSRMRRRTNGIRCSCVPGETPGINVLRDVGLGYQPLGGGAARATCATRTSGFPPITCSARAAARSSSRRPGSAAAAFTTRCAPSDWCAGSST